MPLPGVARRPHATGGNLDPRTIAGLKLWLDASDSASYTVATGVSEWLDKSGNSHAYTQSVGANQPLVVDGPGGRKAFDFDGSNDRLVGGSSTLSLLRNITEWTLFIAWKTDTTNATRGSINWAQNTANTRRTAFGLTTTALRADTFKQDSNTGQSLATYVATIPTAWTIQSQVVKTTTNPGNVHRINGSTVASVNWTGGTLTATSDTDSAAAHIGWGVIAGATVYWDGLISEVLLWQRALTSGELTAVDRYLAARWY